MITNTLLPALLSLHRVIPLALPRRQEGATKNENYRTNRPSPLFSTKSIKIEANFTRAVELSKLFHVAATDRTQRRPNGLGRCSPPRKPQTTLDPVPPRGPTKAQ